MSEQTIYNALRAGGLSRVGVCAMMGNMNAESALISTNVQDNCRISDAEYTQMVDNGTMSRQQFAHDSYGYGLCQWTSYDRKEGLYDLAKSKGVSIGDEVMQCEHCIAELQKQWVGLYRYLCVTEDLTEATKRICSEFERPKINNYAVRINAAQMYFNRLAANDSGCADDACPIEPDSPVEDNDDCTIHVRVLKKGDLGRDVFLLQAGLFDMGYDCGIPDGDFGVNTQEAVRQLQRANGVVADGVADWFVWQTVLNH